MTSTRFDKEKALAEREMTIFDSFSAPLRAVVRDRDVHPSGVLNALLRGVTEAQIIELLTRSQTNETK